MSDLLSPQSKLDLDRRNVRDRFLLVDGHALIYRAYHAFPELTDPTGTLVNAVYGFSRILLTSIRDLQPAYLAVCFDSKEKTKRAEQFADYKAHRPEMPDDLKPQIEIIKTVVTALNIPQFAVPGLEADDLIGSITWQLYRGELVDSQKVRSIDKSSSTDLPLTVILTGDKDLLQLVDSNVHVYIPARSKTRGDIEYDSEIVERMMGLKPDQIIDLKALMGDSSDNIPGVKGIGPKTAVALLQEFKSLDGVYEAVDGLPDSDRSVPPPLTISVLTKLRVDREQAYISQSLARIARDNHLDFYLPDCKVTRYDKAAATKILQQLDFRSLILLLPKDDFELGVQSALF